MFRPLLKLRDQLREIVRTRNFSTVGNVSAEIERAFNDQINTEYFGSFTYMAMALYFARQDVSYPGCHKYFLDQSQEERLHAEKIAFYLLRRGNKVTFKEVEAPSAQCWESPLAAFKASLKLEDEITKKLFDLRKFARDKGDLCACLFVENEFLDCQMEEYDKLSRRVAQLEKIGDDPTGIFVFDRSLLKDIK